MKNLPYKIKEQVIAEIYRDFESTFLTFFKQVNVNQKSDLISWMGQKLIQLHFTERQLIYQENEKINAIYFN